MPQPLLSQQWGLKFKADDVLGLEAAVRKATGKDLAGVGFFTLDGVLFKPAGRTQRYWYSEVAKLNQTYQIPCHGTCCDGMGPGCSAGPSPPPAPAAHGSYTIQAGDSCWNIADKFCNNGNDWKTDICDSGTVCSLLQAGQTIKYDCSGKGTFCGGQALVEMFL